MHYRKFIGSAVLFLALPAFAAEWGSTRSSTAASAHPPGTTYQESKARDHELVCKREHVAGSHIPREVCQTRGEIRQARQDSNTLLQQMENAPSLNWVPTGPH